MIYEICKNNFFFTSLVWVVKFFLNWCYIIQIWKYLYDKRQYKPVYPIGHKHIGHTCKKAKFVFLTLSLCFRFAQLHESRIKTIKQFIWKFVDTLRNSGLYDVGSVQLFFNCRHETNIIILFHLPPSLVIIV